MEPAGYTGSIDQPASVTALFITGFVREIFRGGFREIGAQHGQDELWKWSTYSQYVTINGTKLIIQLNTLKSASVLFMKDLEDHTSKQSYV